MRTSKIGLFRKINHSPVRNWPTHSQFSWLFQQIPQYFVSWPFFKRLCIVLIFFSDQFVLWIACLMPEELAIRYRSAIRSVHSCKLIIRAFSKLSCTVLVDTIGSRDSHKADVLVMATADLFLLIRQKRLPTFDV
jgi:hypothetical protein